MSESFVQVAVDSTGKMLRTQTSVQGGNTVHEEVMVLADAVGNMVGTSTSQTAALQVALQDIGAVSFQRNSAANLAAATQTGAQVVASPGTWTATNTPAAATQATVSRVAGGAGVRHVCNSISASIAAVATGTTAVMQAVLRDGATGAGTILWSTVMAVVPNTSTAVNLTGLSILGSANTAMTIEFTAAGAATTIESVTISGYDVI